MENGNIISRLHEMERMNYDTGLLVGKDLVRTVQW